MITACMANPPIVYILQSYTPLVTSSALNNECLNWFISFKIAVHRMLLNTRNAKENRSMTVQ